MREALGVPVQVHSLFLPFIEECNGQGHVQRPGAQDYWPDELFLGHLGQSGARALHSVPSALANYCDNGDKFNYMPLVRAHWSFATLATALQRWPGQLMLHLFIPI